MIAQLEIANKLYRCRDTISRFYREEFHEKILPYQKIILAHSKKHDVDTLTAVMEICEMDEIKNEGMVTVLFMAAAVELIEPSNKE